MSVLLWRAETNSMWEIHSVEVVDAGRCFEWLETAGLCGYLSKFSI